MGGICKKQGAVTQVNTSQYTHYARRKYISINILKITLTTPSYISATFEATSHNSISMVFKRYPANISMSDSLFSCSIFSGIGGISLGQPLLYCEIDRRCNRVLRARMQDGSLPKAPIHDDVRTLKSLPTGCQLLFGGFPCQNLSSAGLKAGVVQGKESALFFEMARLARQDRPKYVFFENVNNLRFLPESWKVVLETMCAIGYDCEWAMVSAEMAGASHRRLRWFMLCTLKRDAVDTVDLHLPGHEMYECGQLVDGQYTQTANITGNPVPIELELIPMEGPRPCTSTQMVKKTLKRKRWATPRCSGGSFPALGLTKRCSHDLCTQLRFEKSTNEGERWLDHARPSADWADKMMGFPRGWSDYSKPLKSSKHTFVEEPGATRLMISNIPNSHRLKMLGNACVPQQ